MHEHHFRIGENNTFLHKSLGFCSKLQYKISQHGTNSLGLLISYDISIYFIFKTEPAAATERKSCPDYCIVNSLT